LSRNKWQKFRHRYRGERHITNDEYLAAYLKYFVPSGSGSQDAASGWRKPTAVCSRRAAESRGGEGLNKGWQPDSAPEREDAFF
jgi:hypothetical protein